LIGQNNKVMKLLSTSSILVICGTFLAANNQITAGLIMVALGTLGSLFSFAMDIQKSNSEAEERKTLYENLQQTIGTSLLMGTSNESDSDRFH